MTGPQPLSADDGFTLVELLIVTTMLTVVLGAVLGVLVQGTQLAAGDRERGHAIREAQVQVDAVVREARQAFRIHPSTSSRLDIAVHRAGTTRRVAFDCSAAHPSVAGARRCVRQELAADGTVLSSRVAIDRVLSSDVFAYAPAGGPTAYVTVGAEVPAAGERRDGRRHRVRLHDGFAVRNRGIVP